MSFVGNEVKRRISKQVFQENKARQIFWKTNILTPWYAHVRVSFRGEERFVFRKIWRALFSWNTRFGIRLSLYYRRIFTNVTWYMNSQFAFNPFIFHLSTLSTLSWNQWFIKFFFELLKTFLNSFHKNLKD